MPDDPILLVADALSHDFSDKAGNSQTILKGLSLSLSAGQSIAILGSSGSGKTTLLHFLAGLSMPDLGDVIVLGQSYRRMKSSVLAEQRNQLLGFVYQHHFLLPGFNVIENVAMPLFIRGTDHKQAMSDARHALQSVGLLGRELASVQALSGGERQRIAVARALVTHPRLIIADEPTGSLDEQNSAQLMDLLLGLCHTQNIGLVIATHDVLSAAKVSMRYHLNEGRLCAE
jgi:lipoprotein-releasing system ATP-binding protein